MKYLLQGGLGTHSQAFKAQVFT